MKRWVRAVTGGMVICVLLSLCGFEGTCNAIRKDVVRLHILANSDSEADQALKTVVRDAVTEKTVGWLDGVTDEQEALTVIETYLPQLQAVAQQTVYEQGFAYPVQVSLCDMYFSTREYEDITMPAGTYTAVRIEIGQAQGKNWWCVVYPPMCIRSAVKEQTLTDVLNGREMTVVSGDGYVVRFKIVEVVQWLLSRVKRVA